MSTIKKSGSKAAKAGVTQFSPFKTVKAPPAVKKEKKQKTK